ncbi:hypothetical protein, partial [Actinomadura rubrisoli]|uniref:hypothetical protein n=1 Tax=Actinomadura rubrisoli TaxID=2530368 RepID=UPI001A9E843D
PASPSGPVTTLLTDNPATCDAIAALLGHPPEWEKPKTSSAAKALLTQHPEPLTAIAALLA